MNLSSVFIQALKNAKVLLSGEELCGVVYRPRVVALGAPVNEKVTLIFKKITITGE